MLRPAAALTGLRAQLEEIRNLSGSDATTMYGTGHGGGAILVVTKCGR